MNFYPHHIGDFNNSTRHLTRLERSVYRDLIELYYDTEGMLPLDHQWICRKIIARTDEESTAVQQTLNEFFTRTETGWYHERCEGEISHYRANNSQKAMAGKASAAAKALRKQQAINARSTPVGTNVGSPVEQTNNGTPTNQEPLTKNHEPGKKTVATSVALPDGVLQQTWDDFLKIRKAKRAPMTQTALDLINREADKAGMTLQEVLETCCQRGWQGFQASWVAGNRGGQQLNRQETLEAHNQDVADRWLAKQGDDFDPV